MARKSPDKNQLHELLYQALETEAGGIKIYETAISCAVNSDLREEWEEYLDQTKNHHRILLGVFEALELNPETMTAGREVVSHIGNSLVQAMELAKSAGDPDAAQLVAGECVVHAETKDHMNWELIGLIAEKTSGPAGEVLKRAYEEVEKEEDHHLYHTKGWTRELWIDSLGLPAVLPPPEEIKNVETAIGASRAEQSREDHLRGKRSH
jgi:hypothetical protein